MDIKFEGGHPLIYTKEIESMSSKHRLIEIPEGYLSHFESLVHHQPTTTNFSIVGLEGDETVLVTDRDSFVLKEAESSNSFLLTSIQPNIETKSIVYDKTFEVQNILDYVYSATPIVGRLDKVKKLLLPTAFRGQIFDKEISANKFYSYEDLVNEVQASKAELDEFLNRSKVVTMQGKLRLIDNRYYHDAVDTLMDLFVANELEPSNFTLEQLTTIFRKNALPEVVFVYILLSISDSIGGDVFAFNNESLNRALGEAILFNAPGKKMTLLQFQEVWSEQCQHKDTVHLDLLSGLYYLQQDQDNPEITFIHYLDRDDLPFDLKKRIKVLFTKKSMWPRTQLEPYLRPLVKEDTETAFLKELAKYLKMMVDDNEMSFRTRVKVDRL